MAQGSQPTETEILWEYPQNDKTKKVMKLVIVESPTKAKTISKFLSKDYSVESSFGHIRDLPAKELGIDIKNNFEPTYVIPDKAKPKVKILKDQAKKSKEIILATDEDREGEAIAWHLAHILELKNPKRIVFHEITKPAIEAALQNPRTIDLKLVDAQQARRILDRLVGFKLSPFLWKKVMRGLSAGRVQSVAVRLICDREKEIASFIPQEYWTVEAVLQKQNNAECHPEEPAGDEGSGTQCHPEGTPEGSRSQWLRSFGSTLRTTAGAVDSSPASRRSQNDIRVALIAKDGKTIDKLEIKNKDEAEKILNDLQNAQYKVANVERKETKRNPLPPFTTSTLQQTAAARFGFSAKRTMMTAQKLYENGFISYHRTDSLNLSAIVLAEAKKYIQENLENNYWLARVFKTKSQSAQEAHEAIRPTYPDQNTPENMKTKMTPEHFKIYDLIWRRFIACQMESAIFDATVADISANQYTFRANGQVIKFDGFLKIYPTKFEETNLPILEKNETLNLKALQKEQHFTEGPARYSEATLIKVLEKQGIGRPSTYAPTLDTIQNRNYVEKDDNKRLKPTKIGAVVNELLTEHFPQIVDVEFTAKMEKELDEVAEGKDTWQKTIGDFYTPFEKNLKEKEKIVERKDLTEKTDKVCPECAGPMIIRPGRFGKFFACKNFPKCKHTENIPRPALGVACPKCGGDIVEKNTKKKKIFYGCSNWPKCDFAAWDKPINQKCEQCGSQMTETKYKKVFCSNKDCVNAKKTKSKSSPPKKS